MLLVAELMNRPVLSSVFFILVSSPGNLARISTPIGYEFNSAI